MRSRAISAAVLITLLTACATQSAVSSSGPTPSDEPPGGSPAPTSAPTSTPSPSPVPTPTVEPTPDIAAFAQMYLDLVAPYNAVVCDFQSLLDANPNAGRADLQPLAERMADATRAWVDGVRAIEWPEDTQEAIDDLIASNAAQEAALRGAIGSTTDVAFFDNLNRSFDASAEGSGAAQLARITLELEGIPTNACE